MTENKIRSIFPMLAFITGATIECMILLFNYDTNTIEVVLVSIIALATLIFGFRYLYF
jgi:hypothetical protein